MLRSLLKDEENRVHYIFKKSAKPEVKEDADPHEAAESGRSKPKSHKGAGAKTAVGNGTVDSPVDLSD